MILWELQVFKIFRTLRILVDAISTSQIQVQSLKSQVQGKGLHITYNHTGHHHPPHVYDLKWLSSPWKFHESVMNVSWMCFAKPEILTIKDIDKLGYYGVNFWYFCVFFLVFTVFTYLWQQLGIYLSNPPSKKWSSKWMSPSIRGGRGERSFLYNNHIIIQVTMTCML